jgi:BMFP domain-containing protein YqiC
LLQASRHPIVADDDGLFSAWDFKGLLAMTQTTGRFFDELGKLLTDAAGAADGVRKEVESVVRAQAERVLRDLDVVQREEFEAVKAMAQKAREENERLKERIAALEAKDGGKKAD